MRAAPDTQEGIAAHLSAPLDRAGAWLAGARGWRRSVLALSAGAATALAFAPFYFLPLMAAGYAALVFLLDGAAGESNKRRAAFATGWFFGFGFFLVGLYWMAFSFFVQAEEFAWMAPFAVMGMPAFLALFFGGAAALAVSFWRPGASRVLVFAAALMLFEYARGHILTGLPWNLPGQALAGTAAGAQSAAIYGVYGLSLVALLAAMAPAAWKGAALKGVGISLGLAALLFGGGAARLAMPGPGVHDDVIVRVVQPNIPQREKIDWDLWGRNFAKHIELSKGAAPQGAKLFVLWPENAASLVTEVDGAMEMLAQELPRESTLLAGSVRRESDAAGKERYYNSLAVIAMAPKGGLLNAPDSYMDKIAVGPGYPAGIVDLDAPAVENIEALAKAKGVPVGEITACVLDRPRHARLIEELRATGVSVRLIGDGDVAGIIHTTDADETGIDIYMGIGGAPEGVLAAAALRCIGGQMQGRLVITRDEQVERAHRMGIDDIKRKYTMEDMAKGDVLFAATGVTDGNFLQGVRFGRTDITTHTVVMRAATGTVRYIKARHTQLEKFHLD